ncbi:MAG: hypothetical protein WCV72_03180 [Patescibacteria group bacterium]
MTNLEPATNQRPEAESAQIENLRKRVERAFATQLSPVALRDFCKRFSENKWRKKICADLEEFAREGPSEMLDLALLSVREEEAELIAAYRDTLELLGIRPRENSDGTTTILLKRKTPKLRVQLD